MCILIRQFSQLIGISIYATQKGVFYSARIFAMLDYRLPLLEERCSLKIENSDARRGPGPCDRTARRAWTNPLPTGRIG